MSVSHPRALFFSILVGTAIAVVAGGLFSLFGDRQLLYSIGSMLFGAGLIALALGLLGATEPSEGWATGVGKRRRQEGRRSLAAKLANQKPDLHQSSPWELAVWGVVVGGGLIGLSMLAFALSS